EHLLAMKVLAARRRDAEDIRFLVKHLRLADAEDVLALCAEIFPDEDVPARAGLGLEGVVGGQCGRGSGVVCHRATALPLGPGRRTGSGSPAMTWAWAWAWAWFACCIVRPTEVDARNTVGRSPPWRPVRWRADRAAWLATSYTYRVGSISKVVTRR